MERLGADLRVMRGKQPPRQWKHADPDFLKTADSLLNQAEKAAGNNWSFECTHEQIDFIESMAEAATAGADYIAPYFNRIQSRGSDHGSKRNCLSRAV